MRQPMIAVPLVQAPTMTAPEIYYYSPAENGFVIEQADGTHGAILGRGIVPDEHTMTFGPGWSPSGECFAWASAYSVGGPGAYSSYPWIVSRDGTKRLTLLDGTGAYGVHLTWAPQSDLLLASIPYEDWTRESSYLQLIDPNSESVLAQYENASQSNWSPHGTYFSFTQNVSTDPMKSEIHLVIASPAGIVSERPFERDCASFGYHWSPDDRLIYMDEGHKQLIFEDVMTHVLTRVQMPTSSLKHID
jgi:hypothetical protein